MNFSLLTKQLYDIIANEPGNENKMHPVFEVGGISTLTLFQNLHNHFINKKTKNRLPSYQIMRLKDPNKFKNDENIPIYQVGEIVKNVQMNGIAFFRSFFYPVVHRSYHTHTSFRIFCQNNNGNGVSLGGYTMKASNTLKEIHIDSSNFGTWNMLRLLSLKSIHSHLQIKLIYPSRIVLN